MRWPRFVNEEITNCKKKSVVYKLHKTCDKINYSNDRRGLNT